MDCLSCGRAAEFERVVVGRADRPVFGVLCRECEKRHLGPLVTDADVSADGCCLCPGDGVYALPEWDAIGVSEDDGELEFLEYSIESTTPSVCEEHYQAFADPDLAVDATGSSSAVADD